MDRELIKLRKKDDPIRRNAEKEIHDEGTSPMAPPDLYSPPGENQGVPYEEMHAFLQAFRDEHEVIVAELNAFEAALAETLERGPDREIEATFSSFFRAIDEKVIPHNRLEEERLFPLLAERLIEHGEHSKGQARTTAIDVLKDDHLEIVQLSAVIFNFFAVASRLPDPQSRGIVFKAAVEQGQVLAELLRLHMFREDHVVFSLAHEYLSAEELDAMVVLDQAAE